MEHDVESIGEVFGLYQLNLEGLLLVLRLCSIYVVVLFPILVWYVDMGWWASR